MANILLNLPKEIAEEILLRLPPKSLCRFLAVCKTWCRLITSQAFINLHLNKNLQTKRNNHVLIRVCELDNKYMEEEFSFYPHHQTIDIDICKSLGVPSFKVKAPVKGNSPTFHQIIGTCNGLICMEINCKVLLYNPSIQKIVDLPPYSLTSWTAYRPKHVFGFGVNLLNGDFKVIRVLLGSKTLSEVYSLKTGEWVEIDGAAHNIVCPFPGSSHVYLNGRSHWIVNVDGNQVSGSIISFDMSDEVFREVSVTEELARACECSYYDDDWDSLIVRITTMTIRDKECLAMVINEEGGRFGSYGIWVMIEYGVSESWTNIYTIDKEVIGSEMMRCLREVNFLMSNENILMIAADYGKLACFNPLSKLVSEVDIDGFGLHAVNYMESLVLLEPR